MFMSAFAILKAAGPLRQRAAERGCAEEGDDGGANVV